MCYALQKDKAPQYIDFLMSVTADQSGPLPQIQELIADRLLVRHRELLPQVPSLPVPACVLQFMWMRGRERGAGERKRGRERVRAEEKEMDKKKMETEGGGKRKRMPLALLPGNTRNMMRAADVAGAAGDHATSLHHACQRAGRERPRHRQRDLD